MTTTEHPHVVETPGVNTRDDWKNTILAGLANYIDAGSIVAGSVALAFERHHVAPSTSAKERTVGDSAWPGASPA